MTQTLYEDRGEFRVGRSGALNRVVAAALRPLMTIGFAHRHRVVRTAVGHARRFARLQVRFAPAWLSFLPLVWGDYWIIGLAPDYSWAVVGDPGRKYLWILARTPQLDGEHVAAARAAASNNGFDVTRLVATPQTAPGHRTSCSSEHLEASAIPGAVVSSIAHTREVHVI